MQATCSGGSTVSLKKISILPRTQLSKTALLGDVQLEFDIKGEALGSQSLVRKFPLSLRIDSLTGNIQQCGAIDDELTAKGYIVPGLGDAGDLAYGAKIQS